MPRSLQTLLGQPLYATLVLSTLALAVGVNLIVFGIVNALWLRPNAFKQPDRVVIILNGADSESSTDAAAFGTADIFRSPAFVAVAGQVATGPRDQALVPHVLLTEVGREVETVGVTADYFAMLGLEIRGRDFRHEDDRRGAEPVAIISDRVWRVAFGGRDDVIGAVVSATPFPLRIIGVAPPDFQGARRGERTDMWIPRNLVPRVSTQGDLPEDMIPVFVMARLREGVTPTTAESIVAINGRAPRSPYHIVRLSQTFGAPGSRTIAIDERSGAALVACLASLVLLAGCGTMMALVLVHYEGRRQEFAVRLALGARRAQLLRQLAAELAWLAIGGSAVAIWVGLWGLRAVPALSLPGGVDLARLDLAIDWRVLLAGIVTSLVTLSCAAVLPVARFTRTDVARQLVTATGTSPSSSQRIRRTLLALHVAATVIILVSAGLFVSAVIHGFTTGPGFDIEHTLFMNVQVFKPMIVPGEDMSARQTVIATRTQQLLDRVSAFPGVQRAVIGAAPIGTDQAFAALVPRTVTTGTFSRDVRLGAIQAGPGFLEALGVPIVAGRSLTAADASVRPVPVVVTSSLARRLWPKGEELGQTLALSRGTNIVVGVARDFRFGSLSTEPPGVLVTATDRPGLSVRLTVRASRPTALVAPLRQLVTTILPDAPPPEILTGRDIVRQDLGRQRLGAWFFSGFGLVALVLGIGGVFGLVAYLAESRRREFGIRMALGASTAHVIWQALSAGLAPVLLGTVVGLMASGGLARFVASFLVGISPFNPVTYACAAVVMITSATAAGLVACQRLHRLRPGDALRSD